MSIRKIVTLSWLFLLKMVGTFIVTLLVAFTSTFVCNTIIQTFNPLYEKQDIRQKSNHEQKEAEEEYRRERTKRLIERDIFAMYIFSCAALISIIIALFLTKSFQDWGRVLYGNSILMLLAVSFIWDNPFIDIYHKPNIDIYGRFLWVPFLGLSQLVDLAFWARDYPRDFALASVIVLLFAWAITRIFFIVVHKKVKI